MPKRLTTEEFIQKAKAKHGDTYSYKNVVYQNSHTNVLITCREHGDFPQTPSNHLSGKGCVDCGGSAPVEFEKFVNRAIDLHNDRYLYDRETFTNMRDKTKIFCRKHDWFEQRPYVHLRPNGCKSCADEGRAEGTRKQRYEKLRAMLRDKFDGKISVVGGQYINGHTELSFSCATHGEFKETPQNVIYTKHGCTECYLEFINKDTAFFDDDQSLKDWIGDYIRSHEQLKRYHYQIKSRSKNSAIIIGDCPQEDHAKFEFTLERKGKRNLLQCRSCVNQRRQNLVCDTYDKKRYEYEFDWRQAVANVHGDYYDLSQVEYVNARSAISVGCPKHGYFKSTPDLLLHGGCRLCADEDLKGLYSSHYFEKNPDEKEVEAEIYYLRIQVKHLVFYKVGITKSDTNKRHAMLNSREDIDWKILQKNKSTLYKVWQLEQEIHADHSSLFPIFIPIDQEEIRRIRLGPTECFARALPQRWTERIKNLDERPNF